MTLWRVGLRSTGLVSHYQRDPAKACYLALPVSCPGYGNNTHPMEAVVRNVIFHIRKPLPTETISSSLEKLLQEIKRDANLTGHLIFYLATSIQGARVCFPIPGQLKGPRLPGTPHCAALLTTEEKRARPRRAYRATPALNSRCAGGT